MLSEYQKGYIESKFEVAVKALADIEEVESLNNEDLNHLVEISELLEVIARKYR